jgi:DNA end-binding protein Ku
MASSLGTRTIQVFGIPLGVKIYSALKPRKPQSHRADTKTGQRVKHAPIVDGKIIAPHRVGQQVQATSGAKVMEDREKFNEFLKDREKLMSVQQFTDISKVPLELYESFYSLGPQERFEPTFVLVHKALRDADVAGVLRFLLPKGKSEYVALMYPHKHVLRLHQLRYQAEILEPNDIVVPSATVHPEHLKLVLGIIRKHTDRFRPEEYRDVLKEERQRLIDQWADDVKTQQPAATRSLMDVMEQVKAEVAREPRTSPRKPPKRMAPSKKPRQLVMRGVSREA